MKTTEKDFLAFKEEFLRWVDVYGLKDWEVKFVHGDTEITNDAEAMVSPENRQALVGLAKEITREDVRFLAFHEATELFLGKLRTLASDRFTTQEAVGEEIHRLIRVLEKVLYLKEADMAPAGYERMRDSFIRKGMSSKAAKAKAARIWNSKHKGNPVTRKKHGGKKKR